MTLKDICTDYQRRDNLLMKHAPHLLNRDATQPQPQSTFFSKNAGQAPLSCWAPTRRLKRRPRSRWPPTRRRRAQSAANSSSSPSTAARRLDCSECYTKCTDQAKIEAERACLKAVEAADNIEMISKDDRAAHGVQRGVKVSYLKKLAERHLGLTTTELVSKVVRPKTKKSRQRFIELVAAEDPEALGLATVFVRTRGRFHLSPRSRQSAMFPGRRLCLARRLLPCASGRGNAADSTLEASSANSLPTPCQRAPPFARAPTRDWVTLAFGK